MAAHARERLLVSILFIITGAVFVSGIGWGLPSRATDAFLFGAREPWLGAAISKLAPGWGDPALGADVDVNPLDARDRVVHLNATDAQRAEILRRFRLFSVQPDEMITFKALAGMSPGELKLDPKLYQYGGLWIYPVGALLKVGSIVGLVDVRSDLDYYLDRPEAFGRFYIVARLYAAAWGFAGALGVFWITKRCGGGSLVGATIATLCYVLMPVVVNMSHEAKPHLPGTVLILFAVMSAMRFVESSKTRWALLTGALSGAAAGMILSGAIAIVIIPTMALLAPIPWRRRLAVAASSVMLAAVVYFVTNPYVAINLLRDNPALRSNLANSAAMYNIRDLGAGFVNAIRLVGEGASLGLLVLGVISIFALAVSHRTTAASIARSQVAQPPSAVIRRSPIPDTPAGPTAEGGSATGSTQLSVSLLLGVPVVAVMIQFIALAAGKPGEYARFALLPDVSLAIATGTAIGLLVPRDFARILVGAIAVLVTAAPSWFYLVGFIRDASETPTRIEDAAWIDRLHRAGARTLALYHEPAPYSLPPVNLFEWDMLLIPRDWSIEQATLVADVVIRPVDAPGLNNVVINDHVRASLTGPSDAFPTRISWAGKPFEIWVRRDVLSRAASP